MDSLTQIVLGAAVGEAALGRKVGNKAQLWGAIAGTIPDLDVFFSPLFSDVKALFVHRGFSHSILFAILAAPVLGYLVSRLYKGREAGFKGWTLLFFLGIFTHPLLDCFTNYGTGLFEPFSGYRVSFHSIFVLDPVYTLPMMVACLLALFYHRYRSVRRIILWTGIVLSQLYLGYTQINQAKVRKIVTADLEKKRQQYKEIMIMPAPFTNLLWNIIIKKEDSFLVGYYSLLDKEDELDFKTIPQQQELLNAYQNEDEVQQLIRFSKGFYAVQQSEKGIVFNDLRFGTMNGWFDLTKDYVFSFILKAEQGDLEEVVKKDPQYTPSKEDMRTLFKRIKGDKTVF